MVDNKVLLNNISAERIAAELNRFILGENVDVLMMSHHEIITEIIPELAPTIQFEQNTPYHCYDVFTHTIQSVKSAPPDVKIGLTMLLHDIGKPSCYTEDETGIGHFYGHAAVSAEIAEQVLRRLKYDNDTIDTVKNLILHHGTEIQDCSRNIKQWLNRIGEERLRQLLQVKRADAMAQSYEHGKRKQIILKKVNAMLDEILEQQQCFSLKDLAVNGRDLIELGIAEGKQIGVVLNKLMEMVIDEEVENEREVLLERAREVMEED
jgi:tRNA nucleotidyltransferase (CCA-adding enzyme)